MQNVSGTGNIFTNYHLFVLHAEICDISFLSMWAPVANLYSSPPPQSSLTLHQTPWHLRLQPPHRTVFLKYFPFLQNGQNQPRQQNMISHENWERNWGKNREVKVNFSLSKFWISRREREIFIKMLNFERRTRFFFFKILTIVNISRNEMNSPAWDRRNRSFPLKIFSRSRISLMPVFPLSDRKGEDNMVQLQAGARRVCQRCFCHSQVAFSNSTSIYMDIYKCIWQ